MLSLLSVYGQTSSSKKEAFDSPTSPLKCEEWHLYLGEAFMEWSKNKDASFIVIARLGNGEFSRKINLKRIKTLKNYLMKPKSEIKFVFAEGERTKGFGVIELFVEGRLFYSLPLHRKQDVAEGCQAS